MSKEQALFTAAYRFTAMKSEVMKVFRQDLEHLTSKTFNADFISAVCLAYAAGAGEYIPAENAVGRLRDSLEQLAQSYSGVQLVTLFAEAVASADPPSPLAEFARYLDHWREAHPDTRVDKTTRNLSEKKIKPRNKSQDDPSTEDEIPKYTSQQIDAIRIVLLLRKLLLQRHNSQLQSSRLARLIRSTLTLEGEELTLAQQRIVRRSRFQGATEGLIEAITNAAAATETLTGQELIDLRQELAGLRKSFQQAQNTARRRNAKQMDEPGGIEPTLFHFIIRELQGRDADALPALRFCLARWQNKHAGALEKLTQQGAIPVGQWADSYIQYLLPLCTLLEEARSTPSSILVAMFLADYRLRSAGSSANILYGILSGCYNEICSAFKYPLNSVLRGSVFVECAETLLAWIQLVIDYKIERNKKLPGNKLPEKKTEEETFCKVWPLPFKSQRIPFIDLIYWIWTQENAAYQAAVARKVPMGPDEGKTLGNPHRLPKHGRRRRGHLSRRYTRIGGRGVLGKRGARRLSKWLLAPQVVEETLKHLEVLLYPKQPDVRKEDIKVAEQAPHPYWKKREKRSINAVRPSQYRVSVTNTPVRLRDLSRAQRLKLREQLREQQRYSAQFAEIKEDVERFINPAPPGYPTIEVPLLPQARSDLLPPETEATTSLERGYDLYEKELEWFYDFVPSKGKSSKDRTTEPLEDHTADPSMDHTPEEDYPPEKLYEIETMAAWRLEQSASVIQDVPLQSIYYKRSMGADLSPKSFSLLYFHEPRQNSPSDRNRERFVFVCDLVGEEAEERDILLERERGKTNDTTRFVNFPQSQFPDLDKTAMLFFGVEIGDKYQGQILRDVIARQQRAPIKCQNNCQQNVTGEHLPDCAPEAVISTASIISVQPTRQRTEWYVHLPIAIPAPNVHTLPNAVMGVHENSGNYYFALLDGNGQLRDVGELKVPDNVPYKTKSGYVNENYIFRFALQIIRQARGSDYNALIGIEDVSWQRDEVKLSAAANRVVFSVPHERIVNIARYKATQHAMVQPVEVDKVAPSRDCGFCGHRQPEGSCVQERTVVHCLYCSLFGIPHQLHTITTADRKTLRQCTRCHRQWAKKEAQFKCSKCRKQCYARYNTALVTAHKTIVQVAEAYKRYQASQATRTQ